MKLKKLTILLLTILFLLLGITISKAGYSASNPTVTSGETATITVTSTTALDAYNLDLKSNGGLTFSSCSKSEQGAIININGTSIGYINASGSTKTLGTYKFKVPEVTEKKTYTITFLVDQATEVKATVTVNPKVSNSNTNNNTNTNTNTNTSTNTNTNTNTSTSTETTKGTVSSCYINGIKVNEYLNVKNKDSVSIKVNTSTGEGLKIYNNKTDKTYTVKSGATTNIQIVEGTQTLTITLNSGYKTTRKIISTKEGEEVLPNQIEEKKDVRPLLKKLEIEEFEIVPEFSSEVYEYNLTIPEEKSEITELKINAIANSDEFIVEIIGNEEFSAGENIVTILVKSKDSEEVTTYKITVNKKVEIIENIETVETMVTGDIEENLREIQKIDMPRMLIAIFTGLIAIAGIIFAVIEYNYGKKQNEEEEGKKEKISFASIGYENESIEKEDVLEEIKKEKISEQAQEEIKTKKKGKHF